MTRAEAEALCARHAAEHPDREHAQWRPQDAGERGWIVVRVSLAPAGDTTPTQVAEERPPTADDPRSAAMQNLGPHIGPIF